MPSLIPPGLWPRPSAACVAAPADDVDVLQPDDFAVGSSLPGFGGVVAREVVDGAAVGTEGLEAACPAGQGSPGVVVPEGLTG